MREIPIVKRCVKEQRLPLHPDIERTARRWDLFAAAFVCVVLALIVAVLA